MTSDSGVLIASENVRISNCHIDVGDDCITIKSGYNEDGRRVGIPCENFTITNCTMLSGHCGVVIGSEMSGDVRNVTILEVRNALDLEIDQFSTRNPHPETPVVLLEGVDGALIRDCIAPDGADPFLQLTGQENRGIRVSRPEFTDPIGDEKDRSGSQAVDS